MRVLSCFLLPCLLLLSVCSSGQSWKEYADSAAAYQAQGDTEKAIANYKLARTGLATDSSRTLTYAGITYKLADLLSDAFLLEEAEKLFRENIQLLEKITGKADHDYIKSCSGIAIVYAMSGNFEKAEKYFLEVRELRGKVSGKQNTNYAASCNNLGSLYLEKGQYDKAEPFYLEARSIHEHLGGKTSPGYARITYSLAALHYSAGRYENAESLYLEALPILRDSLGVKSTSYLNTINGLGVVYNTLGDKEKAEQLYLEAKEIYAEVLSREHPDYANACINLGSLYYSIGQFKKAEDLYLEAKSILEKVPGKTHPDYALCSRNLGAVYHVSGHYEKAELFYTEAKNIWEAIDKTHPFYASSCINLAFLYKDLEQYQKAEPLLTEALQLQEKALGKMHPDYASTCDDIGTLSMLMGQYERARKYYTEAKAIHVKLFGKKHTAYQVSCANLGQLYWATQQPSLAEKEYKEVLSVSSYAVKKVFQHTSEKEKTAFLKLLLRYDDRVFSFYTKEKINSELPYAFSLFERQLVLSASQTLLRELNSTGDTALREKFSNWMQLRKNLAVQYALPADKRGKNLANLEEKSEQLEKELNRLSISFRNQQERQGIHPAAVRQALQTGEAAVEFVSFRYTDGHRQTDSTYYMALVLRKDQALPEMVHLFEERQLHDILKIYKGTSAAQTQLNLLYSKKMQNGTNGRKGLYELIWEPLQSKLRDIQTVYYAPAGLLFKVSFPALAISPEKVLGDDYKLVQLNTTASVMERADERISATDKIVLYGGIHYQVDSAEMKLAAKHIAAPPLLSRSLPEDLNREAVPDLNYLEGTDKEIRFIHSLAQREKYPVDMYNGVNATEESFKLLNGESSPAVLHIATHGFFFPDPWQSKTHSQPGGYEVFRQSDNPLLRSGLAMAGANNAWKGKPVTGIEDGILTSYEVANMYLPRTKLAILSACETGLGDVQGSEGVYGLQRAFKMTGVKNLIMSLWRVPDKETSEFMEEFYRQLLTGKAIQDAFYQSQTQMKNKYRNDPYKWAAWVLIR